MVMSLGNTMSNLIKSLTYALLIFGFISTGAFAQGSVSDGELKFRRSGVPHWSEFPAAPKDVPTVLQIKSNVAATEFTRKQVERQISAITWDAGSAETYSDSIHERMNKSLLPLYDAVMSIADIEAFASKMRQKAQTPQPYDRY